MTTPETVYELADSATLAVIESELASFKARVRPTPPVALALLAMRDARVGDVQSCIRLLRQAIATSSGLEQRYYIDILGPILLNVNDLDAAEAVLRSAGTARDRL